VLALVIDRPIARLLGAQASLLVVVYELKTQSMAPFVATMVWWTAVMLSVMFAVLLVVALRRSVRARIAVRRPLVPHPAG
jgi:hypothetical protein